MLQKMEALIFEGPRQMSISERARPVPEAGEVLIAVDAVGICGSELTSFTGASTRRAPGRVFGHEIAGRVAAVGPHVDNELIDKRVAVNPLIPCGRCTQCAAGRSNCCPNRVLLGMQIDGGFAEAVAVPMHSICEAPELDPIGASMVEPLANAMHVLNLLPSITGHDIAVLGAGAIGLSVVSILQVSGAGSITVIDPVANRREQALAAGAHTAYSPEDAPADFEHVVDAAGTASSRRFAIQACAAGGTVVLLGLHSATSELPVNEAIAKELRLQCSYAYTQRDFELALELLDQGRIPYQGWITEMPLSEGHDAFVTLADRPEDATKIVLRPHPGE